MPDVSVRCGTKGTGWQREGCAEGRVVVMRVWRRVRRVAAVAVSFVAVEGVGDVPGATSQRDAPGMLEGG